MDAWEAQRANVTKLLKGVASVEMTSTGRFIASRKMRDDNDTTDRLVQEIKERIAGAKIGQTKFVVESDTPEIVVNFDLGEK